MARIRIGEILIKQGLLTDAQLQEAISLQKQQKGARLGEILIQVGINHEGLKDYCRGCRQWIVPRHSAGVVVN